MTPDEFLQRVRKIRPWKSRGRTAPHKPFLLLIALARVTKEKDRLVSYREVERSFDKLWRKFGPEGPARAYYPFGRLRKDKLWEIPEIAVLPSRDKADLSPRELRDHNVKGGFPRGVFALLKSDEKLIFRAAQLVLIEHLPSSPHGEILAAVGLRTGGLVISATQDTVSKGADQRAIEMTGSRPVRASSHSRGGRTSFDRFTRGDIDTARNLAALVVEARDRGIAPTNDDVWLAAIRGRLYGEGIWPEMPSRFLAAFATGWGATSVLDLHASLGSPVFPLAGSPSCRATALCPRQEVLEAVQVLDHHNEVKWLPGGVDKNPQVLKGQFDLIVCSPPLGTTSVKRRFAGVSWAVRDSPGHLLIPRSCSALSVNGIGVFVVSPRFLSNRRNDSVRRMLPDFGLSLAAYVSVPPQPRTYRHRVGLAFIRKGESSHVFGGILSEDEERNQATLKNLIERVDSGSVATGRLVASSDFVSPETLASTERVDRLATTLRLKPQRLGDIAQEIKPLGRGGPSGFEERSDVIYLPLIPSERAATEVGQLQVKARDWVQVVLNEDIADPSYVARFLNSAAGRMVREAGVVAYGAYRRLPPRGVGDLVLFLPNKATQLRILETDSKAASLMSEVREIREQLWQRPLAEARVRDRLEGVNRDDSLPAWLDKLPFPLASILWAYHAAAGNDKEQYEHLDHFFEALSAFLATLALSAFWTDKPMFEREWPSVRSTLESRSLSIRTATMGTWITIAERLFKRARQMLGSQEVSECDECLQAFCTADRSVLGALLSKNLVSAVKKANSSRNMWRGHGGIVSASQAYQLRVTLFDILNEVRESFGTVWTRYRLVRAGDMRRLPDGTYQTRVEVIMGRSYPFPSRSVSLEEPVTYGQLYFLGEAERRALPILPFITLEPSPDEASNACYFFNRARGEEIRLVSYHFESKPALEGEFRDTRQILDELSVLETVMD